MSPPETPKYSILITSFRSLRFLEECLGSFVDLEGPAYELLFLDNGSPEPEAEWVRAHMSHPGFKVFSVPETKYFAGGMNYLADRAQGEFIVLMNSDAHVDRNWLKAMDAYLEETGYEVAGSDVRQLDKPEIRGDARFCLDVFGRIRFLPPSAGPTFTAGGCGMAIRRDVFFELGCLDEDYKMYFEEVDFCWRLDMRGHRVGFASEALIYHVGQGSASKTGFYWNRFRGRRNRIWSFFKNAGPWMLLAFIPAHLVICLAGIAMNLLTFRFREAFAEIAALGAAVFHLRIPLSKRAAIQRSRTVSDSQLIARNLILLPFKSYGPKPKITY